MAPWIDGHAPPSQHTCQLCAAQGEKLSFVVDGVMVSEVEEEDGPQVGAQAGGLVACVHGAAKARPLTD